MRDRPARPAPTSKPSGPEAARWRPSFGPSALATPANAVTIGRLVCAPSLWLLILLVGPSYGTLAIWIVLAATDGVDGYLARRHGTTRSGAFLDPLADKALVLGAMWALVADGVFWWLPVVLISAREVAISAFRSYWGRRGLAVPAPVLGQGQDRRAVASPWALALLPARRRRPRLAGVVGAVGGGGAHAGDRRPVPGRAAAGPRDGRARA